MKPDGNVGIGRNEEHSKWHIQHCVLWFVIYMHVLYMKTIAQNMGIVSICGKVLRFYEISQECIFLTSEEITKKCKFAQLQSQQKKYTRIVKTKQTTRLTLIKPKKKDQVEGGLEKQKTSSKMIDLNPTIYVNFLTFKV